nr:hypothetical protein [Tanacetum cinerariifolium]
GLEYGRYGLSKVLDTAYRGFLEVGTTFDISKNILFPYSLNTTYFLLLDTTYWILFPSGSLDIYAAGSKSRPPMLNKENYVPWSSCPLRHEVLFKTNGHLNIYIFTDADWAGDNGNRRSTSGYFFLVGEALWIRKLVSKIRFPSKESIRIMSDNKAAIQIPENPVQHDRTKHVEVDRHFIKEKLEVGIIKLPFVKSEDQLADILTKTSGQEIGTIISAWLSSPTTTVGMLASRSKMIEVTNEKVTVAKEKLKEARTRQKSYADKYRRSIEFQPGDRVFLKVSPARGVRRFGYKYHPLHVISYPLDQIHADLSYVEEPEAILDHQDRVMSNKAIPFVKILWRNHPEREATWETEESIRTFRICRYSTVGDVVNRLPVKSRSKVGRNKNTQHQIAQGGYSIFLTPPPASPWFTKSTLQSFVRFVSMPEILERVFTIESEILQIQDAISIQGNNDILIEDQHETNMHVMLKADVQVTNSSGAKEGNSEVQLLNVLETRKTVLKKEQGMDFARVVAAGFEVDHVSNVLSFPECFGASRLMSACLRHDEPGVMLIQNLKRQNFASNVRLKKASLVCVIWLCLSVSFSAYSNSMGIRRLLVVLRYRICLLPRTKQNTWAFLILNHLLNSAVLNPSESETLDLQL